MENKSSGEKNKTKSYEIQKLVKQNEMKYCFTNNLDNDDLNVKYGFFFLKNFVQFHLF